MNLDTPIRDVMTADVETIGSEATLTDAWTLMLNGGFRHLPVVDGGDLVGLLSASDVMAAVKAMPLDVQPTGVVDDPRSVGDLMTAAVITLGIDATVREAAMYFTEGGFHGLPVVAGRRLVGMFTTADLAKFVLSVS